MNSYGEYQYTIREYECGRNGAATLPTICNLLQEAARLQAIKVGFDQGRLSTAEQSVAWVLTRMRVAMRRYPKMDETITIGTWTHDGRRVTIYRDFEIRSGNEILGLVSAEWALIDMDSRKIVLIPQAVYDLSDTSRPPALGASPFSRLRWTCGETAGEDRFRVRQNSIDKNGHVNNVHYVEWIVSSLPPEVGEIADFEIVFKSETFVGEEVCAAAVEVTPNVWAAHVAAPDGHDHVVASLKTSASVVCGS